MAKLLPFYELAKQGLKIKSVETYMSVADKTAMVSPLLVGDDVGLRTSLSSPGVYDREMIKILYNHADIINKEDMTSVKLKYNDFVNELSNIDKVCLLWGLYKATYDKLAEGRTLTCPKDKTEYKIDIDMNDLIHEDSFLNWEERDENNALIPFYNYRFTIDIPYGTMIYRFNARVPSMANHNSILMYIPIDELQSNMETTGQIFARHQQIALLVDAIAITMGTESQTTSSLEEILMSLKDAIPHPVSEKFFKMYAEKFDKYTPKFYKEVKCPTCGHEYNVNIDMEVEFFRRILLGGESSE